MHISSSYGVEIRKQNVCIRKTMAIYRQAVLYLVHTLDQAWDELSLSRNAANIWPTETASGSPGSAHGRQAGWPMTDREQ